MNTMICGLQKAGVQVFKKVFKYYLNTWTVFKYSSDTRYLPKYLNTWKWVFVTTLNMVNVIHESLRWHLWWPYTPMQQESQVYLTKTMVLVFIICFPNPDDLSTTKDAYSQTAAEHSCLHSNLSVALASHLLCSASQVLGLTRIWSLRLFRWPHWWLWHCLVGCRAGILEYFEVIRKPTFLSSITVDFR